MVIKEQRDRQVRQESQGGAVPQAPPGRWAPRVVQEPADRPATRVHKGTLVSPDQADKMGRQARPVTLVQRGQQVWRGLPAQPARLGQQDKPAPQGSQERTAQQVLWGRPVSSALPVLRGLRETLEQPAPLDLPGSQERRESQAAQGLQDLRVALVPPVKQAPQGLPARQANGDRRDFKGV